MSMRIVINVPLVHMIQLKNQIIQLTRHKAIYQRVRRVK